MTERNILHEDLRHIIDNDLYAWFCLWGPPRTGKSTLCLLLSYWIYRDWDKVLNSIVFNLNGLLYKLQKGEPELWPTRNDLHKRVPLLILDDAGAHCNKAKTQHERGWDIFKGGFDTLGTMIGVLIANMVAPDELTQQLSNKYTHEIFVHTRGYAKYDVIHQQQDFNQWRSRQKKIWRWEFNFEEIPRDVFLQYDEMRTGLAKEVLFSINDTMAEMQVETILKRIQQPDKDLLFYIHNKGSTYKAALIKDLGAAVDDALTRTKSKGLVIPRRVSKDYYKYDLTDLGFSVLQELKKLQS